MKTVIRFILTFAVVALTTPVLATSLPSTIEIETGIAAQQGKFGALYMRCGADDEKIVIGGSLTAWRKETFEGYKGSPEELALVQKAFDDAAKAVISGTKDCDGWTQRAADVWKSSIHLAQYGVPAGLAN